MNPSPPSPSEPVASAIAAALLRSEQRFALAAQAAQIGIWEWDFETGRTYHSPRWKEMLGYKPDELPDAIETWKSRLHPEDAEETISRLDQFMQGPDTEFTLEFRLRHKDGTYRHITSHGVAIRNPLGHVLRLTGSHLDDTETQTALAALGQANLELSRASRTKDAFLSNMSHELRTPLTAILGLSEALLDPGNGTLNETQRSFTEHISQSGHDLLEIVNDLLELSRFEAGKIHSDPTVFPVQSMLENCLQPVKILAAPKEITVQIRIEPGVQLFADPTHIKRILTRLVRNAVKFTPTGGTIGVEASNTPNLTLITVWDTGIGMTEEQCRMLFTPFYQADSGLDRKHQGLGISLALVSRLTKLQKGQIDVESTPGKGTRFTLAFPSPARPHSAQTEPKTTALS